MNINEMVSMETQRLVSPHTHKLAKSSMRSSNPRRRGRGGDSCPDQNRVFCHKMGKTFSQPSLLASSIGVLLFNESGSISEF